MSTKHDQLISASEKMTNLIKEHRESSIYEICLYDVRPDPGRPNRFMLFEISTSEEKKYGSAREIRTWLERRNHPKDKVYNFHLIQEA